MGYYTSYELSQVKNHIPNEVFAEYISEHPDEIWDKYYHNGKTIHTIKAQIVLPAPDLGQIKVVKYEPKVKFVPQAGPKGRKFKKEI